MGFILLIVFILTIFKTWKQSPLYGQFTTRANCNSPLQRAQTYSHHARDAFLCIYMYICERPENTHVGAKSASWRSGVCEQFALPHGDN